MLDAGQWSRRGAGGCRGEAAYIGSCRAGAAVRPRKSDLVARVPVARVPRDQCCKRTTLRSSVFLTDFMDKKENLVFLIDFRNLENSFEITGIFRIFSFF